MGFSPTGNNLNNKKEESLERPNLVLAGFMGTGKTTVGRLVAERLGMPFVDTDALIEADAGMSVREIFAREGEPHFRALEHEICMRVASESGQVIAVGGGALLDYNSHAALEKSGDIILLTCETETLLARLESSALRGERPLLEGDFKRSVSELLEARKAIYGRIMLRVDTTHLTPEAAASKVLELYEHEVLPNKTYRRVGTRGIKVRSSEGDYVVSIGRDLLGNMDMLVRRPRLERMGRKVVVATDSNVAALYGEKVLSALAKSEFDAHLVQMPAGEEHKTWQSVDLFIEGFLNAGLDRSGWVLALGGGVVGDTAGFAASIYMRGVPLVQVPTTLLAMADASIGGKVGVDHPRGKNLLGAFKQPRMVIADLDVLSTLPREQIACGMAEITKAGIIADPTLFALIEETAPNDLDYLEALIRAITVKRDIVERDPYEAGERALLNLGHTFGHAFEKCSGYTRSHGFAVAQGMVVAARLADKLGICEPLLEWRLRSVLEKWGLPVHWGAPDLSGSDAVDRVWQAMLVDKKRRDGALPFVLSEAIGKVKLVVDVPEDIVREALLEVQ
jgi:shikimate kinase/3-dehydroquinate synthase